MTPLERARERVTKAEAVVKAAQLELSKARWAVEFETMREKAKEEYNGKATGSN